MAQMVIQRQHALFSPKRKNYVLLDIHFYMKHTLFASTILVFVRASNEGKLGLAAKAGRWCAGRGCILAVANGRGAGVGADKDGSLGLAGREILESTVDS